MNYQHNDINNQAIKLPVGKVVCVGQNYHDHIKEMGSVTNEQAVLFMKPTTAICDLRQPLDIPTNKGECHNEAEIAVLIKSTLSKVTPEQVTDGIWGLGIGLDLTLREVQKTLKGLGRPWELAKAFDCSAPLSPFTPLDQFGDIQNIDFSLTVNGQLRQRGNTKQMIRPITQLLSIISESFTLLPGDVVLTGTPAGVGPLLVGDELTMKMVDFSVSTKVIED